MVDLDDDNDELLDEDDDYDDDSELGFDSDHEHDDDSDYSDDDDVASIDGGYAASVESWNSDVAEPSTATAATATPTRSQFLSFASPASEVPTTARQPGRRLPSYPSRSSSDLEQPQWDRARAQAQAQPNRAAANSMQLVMMIQPGSSGAQQQAHQPVKQLTTTSCLQSNLTMMERTFKMMMQQPQQQKLPVHTVRQRTLLSNPRTEDVHDSTPIYSIGTDVVAHCLSYLHPSETYAFLTTPLSKTFAECYATPQELWRVLCVQPPFLADVGSGSGGQGEDNSSDASGYSGSDCSSTGTHTELKHMFGRYRLLYTSFIQCMTYLERIKMDAANGKGMEEEERKRPSAGEAAAARNMAVPTSFNELLTRARRVVEQRRRQRSHQVLTTTTMQHNHHRHHQVDDGMSSMSESSSEDDEEGEDGIGLQGGSHPANVDGSHHHHHQDVHPEMTAAQQASSSNKVKFGHSKITEHNSQPGETNLPWSCPIYAVVNWMVAFSDVLGIQVMCLGALPSLLGDERQRRTGQLAGLTGIVTRAMVLFPDSVELHTAAFHTLVLLARPLGARDGTLYHRTMVGGIDGAGVGTGGNNSNDNVGIFELPPGHQHGGSTNQSHPTSLNNMANGTAVVLDSMRRFASNKVLQAMACWSMVNIALVPAQKSMLVRLGGIQATACAMTNHQFNAEVQLRVLFALINLCIPSESPPSVLPQERNGGEATRRLQEYRAERQMLDENVGQIVNLIVLAMRNFHNHGAILNRACLVLHNLCLNRDYQGTLLLTPNCYQMLQWTVGAYSQDEAIVQSVGGMMEMLGQTLRENDYLRISFAALVRALQQQQGVPDHHQAPHRQL